MKVLWCHSYLVCLVFEGSISCFHLENFFFLALKKKVINFEHSCTPSGKKMVTGVQVVTASQVQSIRCRWQAMCVVRSTVPIKSAVETWDVL